MAITALISAAPSGATQKTVVRHRQLAVSTSDCARLLANLRTGTPGQRRQAKGLNSHSCSIRLSDKVVRHIDGGQLVSLGLAPSSASAATNCRAFYQNWGEYVGPAQIATAHVNVGMCWNYSTTWTQWHDCSVTTAPLWGGDVNWCGVYNNGSWYAEPGINFDIYGYGTPWWKGYHYMRFRVYYNGATTAMWGN